MASITLTIGNVVPTVNEEAGTVQVAFDLLREDGTVLTHQLFVCTIEEAIADGILTEGAE